LLEKISEAYTKKNGETKTSNGFWGVERPNRGGLCLPKKFLGEAIPEKARGCSVTSMKKEGNGKKRLGTKNTCQHRLGIQKKKKKKENCLLLGPVNNPLKEIHQQRVGVPKKKEGEAGLTGISGGVAS